MKKNSLVKKVALTACAGFVLATANVFALAELTATTGVNADIYTSVTTTGTSGSAHASTSVSTGTDAGMADTGTVTTATASVMAPVHIAADADLKTYTTALQTSQQNVSTIDTNSNNEVVVGWKHPAKLFGFIPVTISSKTVVSASDNNTVQVVTKLPWWSMFVTGVNDTTWAQTDMKLQQSPEVKANMTANATAQAKAEVVHAVVSQLSVDTATSASSTLGQ